MRRINRRPHSSRQARINDLDQRITEVEQLPVFAPITELQTQVRRFVLTKLDLVELKELEATMLRGGPDTAHEREIVKKANAALSAAGLQDERFSPELVEALRLYWEARGLI